MEKEEIVKNSKSQMKKSKSSNEKFKKSNEKCNLCDLKIKKVLKKRTFLIFITLCKGCILSVSPLCKGYVLS